MSRTAFRVAAVLSAATVLTFAQAPNDTPAGATFAFGNTTLPDDNSFSVVDGPLVGCGFNAVPDLWYYFVPTVSGFGVATTCPGSGNGTGGLGTLGDSVIGVWLDAGGFPGASIGCNDDNCSSPGLASSVSFGITAGVAVYVSVSGYNLQVGSYTLELSENGGTLLPGDDCSVAVPQVGPGVVPFNSAGFFSPGPAAPCAAVGANPFDFFVSYTATQTGLATASTCPSSGVAPGGSSSPTDNFVAAYDGANCPVTTLLGCADGGSSCGVGEGEVTFPVVAGVTYYLQIGVWGSATTISGNLAIAETLPPVNDECTGALPLSAGANGPFTNTGATTSVPTSFCGLPTGDLWFSYTSPCSGDVIFDTCGSPMDTVLSVWDACGGIQLGCSDDSFGNPASPCDNTLQSFLQVPGVTAGQTVYVSVAGWNGATGSFNLNVRCKYIHLWQEQAGPGSIQLENIDGPAGGIAISAVTLDLLHPGLAPAVQFPNGWFYGVPMGFSELFSQFTWPGGLPFVGLLDNSGYLFNLALPAGTTNGLGVSGLNASIWSVGVALDPATGFSSVADTTDPTAYVIP